MNEMPIDIHDVIRMADESGVSAPRFAIDNGYVGLIKHAALWKSPTELPDQCEAISSDREPIFSPNGDMDIVESMAAEVARVIQFPIDTTYMFGLGVVASVLTLNSTYRYHNDTKPVNLYIASAQPPSSGKSGVHSYFMKPVDRNFASINTKNAAARQSIQSDIARHEKEMKGANEAAKLAIGELMEKLYQELSETPIYRWSPTDTTPEALGEMALAQGGYFAVNADEAEALNTLLGATYGDSAAKKNYGVVLKGWDGERLETLRITRECSAGNVRGTINVLAQNETIETLLAAGSRGRGVSERFFIVREPTLKGARKYGTGAHVNEQVIDSYNQLIDALFLEEEICFSFTERAEKLIAIELNLLEPKLGPKGKYGHDMISGFFGKYDKHVRKLSCVLKAIESFSPGGDRSSVVDEFDVQRASKIFYATGQTYVQAADAMNHAGASTEFNCIVDALKRSVSKKKGVIELRSLRDSVKNHNAMKGVPELTRKLKEEYLPTLEENNYLVLSGNKVIINPRLSA